MTMLLKFTLAQISSISLTNISEVWKWFFVSFLPSLPKNRYAMHTCVCYLEIQQSRGKEGNESFAKEGHLCFVSVTFGFHCGCWKAK